MSQTLAICPAIALLLILQCLRRFFLRTKVLLRKLNPLRGSSRLLNSPQRLALWLCPIHNVDESNGNLTPAARKLVEDFVNETFVRRLDEEERGYSENGIADADANGYANGYAAGASELKNGLRGKEQRGEENRRSSREEGNGVTSDNERHGRGKDRVLWFKNWVALQSVRGIDHVHVLVRDVSRHIINEWIS